MYCFTTTDIHGVGFCGTVWSDSGNGSITLTTVERSPCTRSVILEII